MSLAWFEAQGRGSLIWLNDWDYLRMILWKGSCTNSPGKIRSEGGTELDITKLY